MEVRNTNLQSQVRQKIFIRKLGMGRGFLTQEQRQCKPIPDPQNGRQGWVNPGVIWVDPFFKGFFFFFLVFLLFFFLAKKSNQWTKPSMIFCTFSKLFMSFSSSSGTTTSASYESPSLPISLFSTILHIQRKLYFFKTQIRNDKSESKKPINMKIN